MQLPDFVKTVLSALEQAGFECYCVGGCVRDSLLSLPCADYDVTTSALPNETRAALSPIPIIETGLKHGTVTAILNHNPVEITTFRSECGYSDHRHPDAVSFAKTLKEDLSRRDFTVNALAFSEKSGIIDLFGGRDDLENKLIRCVGEARERFSEDALRILRALRFASCLGFSIEEKTAVAIKENYELLSFVSKERIYSELCRLVCGKNAAEILKAFPEVFAFVFSIKGQDKTFWERSADSLESLPAKPYLRFAALLRPILSAEEARAVLLSLKAERATISSVCSLIESLPLPQPKDRREIKQLLRAHGQEKLSELILLERAAANSATLSVLENQISDIIKSGECFSLATLEIDGSDLASLGHAGAAIGSALNALLSGVISGELPNERQALLSAAKKML